MVMVSGGAPLRMRVGICGRTPHPGNKKRTGRSGGSTSRAEREKTARRQLAAHGQSSRSRAVWGEGGRGRARAAGERGPWKRPRSAKEERGGVSAAPRESHRRGLTTPLSCLHQSQPAAAGPKAGGGGGRSGRAHVVWARREERHGLAVAHGRYCGAAWRRAYRSPRYHTTTKL